MRRLPRPRLNPMIGGVVSALIRIGGYTVVVMFESIWFILQGRRDKLGEVLGRYGRSIVDAVAGAFKS